jgi:hypothetical protein
VFNVQESSDLIGTFFSDLFSFQVGEGLAFIPIYLFLGLSIIGLIAGIIYQLRRIVRSLRHYK